MKCAMTDAGVYSAKGVNKVGDCKTLCTVKVIQLALSNLVDTLG